MRSPRLVYLAVVLVLAVGGFALTRYLADRSSPGLGETVVVPAGSGVSVPPRSPGTPPATAPTTAPPTTAPTTPGADPVAPGSPRTAGENDDRDDDGIDDDLDDAVQGDD
ncbi:hypothetical protein Kfla_0270 [Kribbella flavida DSM 17836]|uniref:Uncharacterized protein n=1 Tax=Kribbella flavida (strain DSM 17836 / JCM 10339 / NBRC 14399) TaxID=479435 RepID=D2PT78_KRIFD|nr:hypothetical protein [Kribbella flavida]ADB29394.1 hypothetical protein Kfla_0270 [Kribbella flavida DSM 17836]